MNFKGYTGFNFTDENYLWVMKCPNCKNQLEFNPEVDSLKAPLNIKCSKCNFIFNKISPLNFDKADSFSFGYGGRYSVAYKLNINTLDNKKIVEYYCWKPSERRRRRAKKDITKQWTSFIKDIENLKLETWYDEYILAEVLDMDSWGLKVSYKGTDIIHKYGEVSYDYTYPYNWTNFVEIIDKYFYGGEILPLSSLI